MLGIVVSRADPASVAIGQALRDRTDWERVVDDSRPDRDGGGEIWRTDGAAIREFADRHLDLTGPAAAFDDPDVLVFASKHAGETGPLLTAHHTGNLGPADHGGDPNALARACPAAHAAVLAALDRHAPADYDVGMEATHHGPTDVGAPSMFVEIGSGPDQWRDPAAASAVAAAILAIRDAPADRAPEPVAGDQRRRHVVGIGGGHYARRFERLVTETEWAVGHVAPAWGLSALGDPTSDPGRALIDELFSASAAEYALFDGDHPDVEAVVTGLGHDVVTETWLRETDGVPLSTVAAAEGAVVAVDEGLRFGHRAEGYRGDVTVRELPTALLERANGIDQAATRAAVGAETIAVRTAQAGSLVVGPVVLPAGHSLDPVIDALVDVLAGHYDEVERRAGVVVARERAFDPALARELGVPEGPAFGALAAGESVTVEGETIDPADVTVERDERYPLE